MCGKILKGINRGFNWRFRLLNKIDGNSGLVDVYIIK
jgi:hypothetical protein